MDGLLVAVLGATKEHDEQAKYVVSQSNQATTHLHHSSRRSIDMIAPTCVLLHRLCTLSDSIVWLE